MEKVHTTPYHPMTNGQCERFNSTLCNMLGTLSEKDKLDWKAHLSSMTHAYNCTQHPSTTYSPYFLMFGRQPRLPSCLIRAETLVNLNKLAQVEKVHTTPYHPMKWVLIPVELYLKRGQVQCSKLHPAP